MNDHAEIQTEIHEWLTGFAQCVREEEYEKGAQLFYEDIYCFGSFAEVMVGRNELVNRQWKMVWPNIRDYDFLYDQLHLTVSKSGELACAMLPWVSTGMDGNGNTFYRPGRVTILLRKNENQKWLAYHTHYSLTPGTDQTRIPASESP